jgi:hypothetical protein
MSNTIKFSAGWLNKSGSFTIFAQQANTSLVAMSTSSNAKGRTCLHTFSEEKLPLLGLSPEQIEEMKGRTHENPLEFAPISAQQVFGMDCKIQILEAVGIADALELGILRKKDNQILGEEASRKKNREKELVKVNGIQVYRKARLTVNSPENKDVLVSNVAPNNPNNPLSTSEDDSEFAESLF